MSKKISEEALSPEWRGTPYILVCRASAPYSGCFWEYNYWLHKERKFYPLHISGYVLKLFTNPDVSVEDYSLEKSGVREHTFLEWADSTNRYSDWSIEKIDECTVAYNTLNSITALLHYHKLEGPPWDCSICKKTHTGMARFLGYKGNGGVGINLTDPCCDDCFDSHAWCDECCSIVKRATGSCPQCSGDLSDNKDEAEDFELDGSRTLCALDIHEPPPSILLSE